MRWLFCGCMSVSTAAGWLIMWGRKNWRPRESWASIALAKDWYPAFPFAKRTKLALCAFESVAIRKITLPIIIPCRKIRVPKGAPQKGIRWICRCGQCARVGCRSIRSLRKTRLEHCRADARAAMARNLMKLKSPSPIVDRLKEQRDEVLRLKTRMQKKTGLASGLSGGAMRLIGSAKGHEYFLKHYLGNFQQCNL